MSARVELHTISQAHEAVGLPAPKHPLVSVVYTREYPPIMHLKGVQVVSHLYQITLKGKGCGTLNYGKNSYDYESGSLVFTSPGQVTVMEETNTKPAEFDDGWLLAFHPDLIRKSGLAEKIGQYTFFNYEVSEALHLSDEERRTIEELLEKIIKEYSQNLDRHSQKLIISNIELLLDYCTRFYDRQFYTRTNINVDFISSFEKLLKEYYHQNKSADLGVPSVQYCAEELHLSPNYLSDLLKKETGKTAQEHIHLFLIDKAKTILLNSSQSISEIGYALGFDYPQRFSNFFKSKTGHSPREYRSLN